MDRRRGEEGHLWEVGHKDDRPPQGPLAEPGLPRRGGRDVSDNVGGGMSAGQSLLAWGAKMLILLMVLIIVAAALHGWSHGLLP